MKCERKRGERWELKTRLRVQSIDNKRGRSVERELNCSSESNSPFSKGPVCCIRVLPFLSSCLSMEKVKLFKRSKREREREMKPNKERESERERLPVLHVQGLDGHLKEAPLTSEWFKVRENSTPTLNKTCCCCFNFFTFEISVKCNKIMAKAFPRLNPRAN